MFYFDQNNPKFEIFWKFENKAAEISKIARNLEIQKTCKLDFENTYFLILDFESLRKISILDHKIEF